MAIIKEHLEEITRAVLELDEMQSVEKDDFIRLLKRAASCGTPDMSKIQAPSDKVVKHDELACFSSEDSIEGRKLVKQVALVKLLGGGGKKMGCLQPKVLTQIAEEPDLFDSTKMIQLNILDIILKQLDALNFAHGCDVPLLLMTSFKTNEDVSQAVNRHDNTFRTIRIFNQNMYPRLNSATHLPLPSCASAGKENWYCSGHGNVYEALFSSGLLDWLLQNGKKYVFISNEDNVGGTIDLSILNHMVVEGIDFCMEVIDRTPADVQAGGLLEPCQLEKNDEMEEFKSSSKFSSLNTNNLWVDLLALKKLFESDAPGLDIVPKFKVVRQNMAAFELKTAAGSAIRLFSNPMAVRVPRSRFLPVRNTADLFLLQSDLYTLSINGTFLRNIARGLRPDPIIELGSHFKKISDYKSRFGFGQGRAGTFELPDIMELDHLKIYGNVVIGKGVIMKGNVYIDKKGEGELFIPFNTVLENQVLEI